MGRLTEKIMKKTELKPNEVKYYEFFYENADLTNKVIMFGDVKSRIREFIKNEQNHETPEKIRDLMYYTYKYWLKKFRSMGLVHKFEVQYGDTPYPVLKGYTPYDDPEFYVAYRKKGEEEWNGRILVDDLLPVRQARMLEQGYEFRSLDD